ncbi:hypothetical protein ACVXHA_25630 [Escherichia coli]
MKAYTPAWAEQITGVSRSQIIRIAREFADNADKTHGRSMIIVGAGLNHSVSPRYELSWSDQHADFLRLCGSSGRLGALCRSENCVRKTGWQPLAFALDWQRPARHMNSTSHSITTPASGVMKP